MSANHELKIKELEHELFKLRDEQIQLEQRIKALKQDKQVIEMVQKRCSKCKNIKSVLDFDKTAPNKSQKLRPECKGCRKEQNAKMYLARKAKRTPPVVPVEPVEPVEPVKKTRKPRTKRARGF